MHNVITLLRNEKIYQEADMEQIADQEYPTLSHTVPHIDSLKEYRHKRIQDKLRFIAELDRAIEILTQEEL